MKIDRAYILSIKNPDGGGKATMTFVKSTNNRDLVAYGDMILGVGGNCK